MCFTVTAPLLGYSGTPAPHAVPFASSSRVDRAAHGAVEYLARLDGAVEHVGQQLLDVGAGHAERRLQRLLRADALHDRVGAIPAGQ
jgi:hypothetical protein